METIKKIFQKTLESFPEVKLNITYEDKLTGIYIIKHKDEENYTLRVGVLGKNFLKSANENELEGIAAHEAGHILAEIEGIAKTEYLSEQDRLEDDMIADKKASERGYKKQLIESLNLTKKICNDWSGSIEARIRKLEA